MPRRVTHLLLLLTVLAPVAGCGVFRSTDPPATSGESAAPEGTSPADTVTVGSMDERLLAGDYAGALAAYESDPELHGDPDATFRAGVAAAMPGHRAHSRFQSRRLLERLIAEHPGTEHRPAAELILRMLTTDADLRRTIARLDRELEQLKAIDLGVEPSPDPAP